MRNSITAILLMLAASAWAAESKGVFENFDADNTDPGLCDVILTDGVGDFYLSGTFGGGTASLQQQFQDGNWYTIQTFTSDPSAKSQTLHAGDGARFRVILSGATSPNLNCNIND